MEIKEHISGVRKMISELKDKDDYHSFESLEDAKKNEKSYLIMEGDYGGQIYLSIPVKLIKCDEETLERLLGSIDQKFWNDTDGTGMYFEVMDEGRGISGGMGGGVAGSALWVHRKLEPFRDKIFDVMSGIKKDI